MNEINPLSLWLVSGLVLLISEMLTGGFFMIFIALGCFAAAVGAALGAPFWAEVVVCAAVAVAGVVTLRKPIQRRMTRAQKFEADLGKTFHASNSLDPREKTSLNYQGAPWSAINVGEERIEAGDRVSIVEIDGNALLIKKDH